MAEWQVYYWTVRDPLDAIIWHTKWERNVVGQVEAPTMAEAQKLAIAEYGNYRETGYRLRVRPAPES